MKQFDSNVVNLGTDFEQFAISRNDDELWSINGQKWAVNIDFYGMELKMTLPILNHYGPKLKTPFLFSAQWTKVESGNIIWTFHSDFIRNY